VQVERRDGHDWHIFKSYVKTAEEGRYEGAEVGGKKKLKKGEYEKFKSTLDNLGWKTELSQAEQKKSDTSDDKVAASVIGELKKHEVVMAKLLKESFKVMDRLTDAGCPESKVKDLVAACRELKKSTIAFEDAIRFRKGEDGEDLTNAEAFVILGRGAEAVQACLEAATMAKSLLGMYETKKSKKK
jgi:hypothetical protein